MNVALALFVIPAFCRKMTRLHSNSPSEPSRIFTTNDLLGWNIAHKKLDQVVFAAYGWETTLSNDEILTRLLVLNQERAED